MSYEDTPVAEIPLKDRLIAQLAFFKQNILNRLGMTPKEVVEEAKKYDVFQKIDPNLLPEERQVLIRDRVLESLEKKGLLATRAEDYKFYKDKFGLESGSAPELYLGAPGGATLVDPNSKQVKIYLNPGLGMFSPDYQVYVLLEEAIHYFQLKHSGRTDVNNDDEREAKDKVLRMADFLSLSEKRRQYLRDAKERYGHD